MNVHLTLLTPLGALVTLVGVVPVVASALVRRRAAEVRRGLGLPEPGLLQRRLPVAGVVAASCLLGLAAAQPRVEWTSERRVRAGTEAYVVVDTSRSMLARSDLRAPIRYSRARAEALRFRAAFPDVPIGVASFTDRVLPHLFPSLDDDVFAATLRRSIGIDRPPPQGAFVSTATRLGALEAVVTKRFFSPTARRRLLLVLTDGESIPLAGARIAAAFRRPPGIETIFVHVWKGDERVYQGVDPEPQYSPDPRSRLTLDAAAAALGGRVYAEGELGGAIATARTVLAGGPTVVDGDKRNRLGLAPWLAAAAFLPLALLLWRRDR